MSQAQTTRDLIISKAYQLFREQGYYHTSMADIGQACDLLKGSIYHYFESKEALMEQVLASTYALFKKQVFSLSFATNGTPKDRLQGMLAATAHAYFQEKGGCLMGQTGSQVANRIPSFASLIRQFFKDWIEAFTHLFKTQYTADQAFQLARQAVIEIEGAVTLYCIFEDKTYLTTTCQRIESLLTE